MANNKKYISLSKLSTFLDNLKSTFASIGHKHTTADLTDYKVDTSLSSTSNNPIANSAVDAEFEAISQAMGALDLAIDGKADSSHSHNDLYYTETEIDQKLSGKANATHNHAISEVANLQSSLDTKVPTSRTINSKPLTENISLSASDVGAAPTSHNHDDRYYTETEIDSKLSGKSDTTHNHDDKYDTKSAVDNKITAHNTATTAHNDIRNLISGLTTRLNTLANSDDTTLDQLSEIVTYIKNNKSLIDNITTNKVNVADIIDNLTTNVTNKPLSAAQGVAIKTLIDDLQEELENHTHSIADVDGLQSALDGKAPTDHGTHVTYSTTAPVMDGTASVGTASTVARSDHKHPTDTSRASKTEFDTHTTNTTVHITSTERTNWNAAKSHADSAHAPSNAEKNQNAFSNIKVGSTIIVADAVADTLELSGNNVTITPDVTNDKVTISVADGTTSNKGIVQLTNSTSSTSTTTAATPSSVKTAYDLANTAKTNAATAQTKADSAYTLAEGKVDSLSDLGITATATELNYMDGVTSNIQTQLDGKLSTSGTAAKATADASGNTITSTYMTKSNPNGTGSLSLNRKASTTIGDYSVAEGYNTIASGKYSHAEGNETIASGESSHSEGAKLTESLSRTISGTKYTYDVSIEGKASELAAHSEGSGTQATNKHSHAEGRGTIASGIASHAEGTYGYEASVSDGTCTWTITPTTASGVASHAEGYGTKASGYYAHAEGKFTEASSEASHAEGTNTKASALYTHAEGEGTTANGRSSHSEGGSTIAKGQYSHAEGFSTLASSNHQHVQGRYNIEDTTATYAHIVGNGSASKRSNAHTIDWNGNAWFKGDVYVSGTGQDDEAAVKLAKMSDIPSMELLWENASPASSFAAQSLTLNVPDDAEIGMVFGAYQDSAITPIMLLSDKSKKNWIGLPGSRNVNRIVTFGNDKITFTDAKYSSVYNGGNDVIENALLIPYKIYAVNGMWLH